MLKKYKVNIILFYAISVVALIIAGIWDLQLDIALNNPSDAFAIWLRNTGEIPARLICPFAGAVLFYTYKNKLEKIVGFIICMGGSAYFGYYIGKYFFLDENRFVFSIIYGIGFGVVCLVVGNFINIPNKNKDILRALAITGVVVMFAQIIVIEGSKYLWGRVRFRDLLSQGSYDAFTPWYHPNGINGNKSFPSGHTAGAGMSYLMMFFPYLSTKWEKKSQLCFWVPCIYTSVVAFTRLVMGAHYLSDVTAGGIISFTIVIIAIKIFDKKVRNSVLDV